MRILAAILLIVAILALVLLGCLIIRDLYKKIEARDDELARYIDEFGPLN